MKYTTAVVALSLLVNVSLADILVQEDFEDDRLADRGWYDIAKWGQDRSLSIVGEPEVKPAAGKGCLKIRYAKGDTGGWMHMRLPKQVPEVYCRYYRMFPAGWEWPKGYGPHDSIVFAGSYGSPTDTDLSVYLDFWKTGETFVRVATARQKWGYGGYSDVLRTHGGVANRVAFNVAQPELVRPGKWHCVEYYVKLSQPGREDGRLKLWVSGKLVCDLPGLPLVDRNHAGILLNHWMLGPYFHGGSHRQQHNYLDALVIATEYVGTFQQQGNQPPRARLTYTRDWGSMTARFAAAASADPDGTIAEFAWDFGDGRTASSVLIPTVRRSRRFELAMSLLRELPLSCIIEVADWPCGTGRTTRVPSYAVRETLQLREERDRLGKQEEVSRQANLCRTERPAPQPARLRMAGTAADARRCYGGDHRVSGRQ